MTDEAPQGLRRLTRFAREPAAHVRFFSSASDAARARRPTDAVLVFTSIVVIALMSFVPSTSALVSAVIVVTAPHLGRPIRRIGRWLIPLGAAAALALGLTSLIGMVVGVALGYGAAALVHLVVGSPGGKPTPDEVREALGALGLDVVDVRQAALAPRGVALMEAT